MKLTEVRADFERLETIRECNDWAWVEEDFRLLLEDPTAKRRKFLYGSLIRQWFSESGESSSYEFNNLNEVLPEWALKIADKHGIDRTDLAQGGGE